MQGKTFQPSIAESAASHAKPTCELLLCAECGHALPTGPVLTENHVADLTSALPATFAVRTVPCMNICDAPVTAALQGGGRATYIFKGVDPATDLADLVATCVLYQSEAGGWIEDARACGRLRHCLVGRVPALTPTAGEEPPR